MRADKSLRKLKCPLSYIQKIIVSSQTSKVKFYLKRPHAEISVLEQLEPPNHGGWHLKSMSTIKMSD